MAKRGSYNFLCDLLAGFRLLLLSSVSRLAAPLTFMAATAASAGSWDISVVDGDGLPFLE